MTGTCRIETGIMSAHPVGSTEKSPSALPTLALCGLAMVAEGFDTYSVGYAAPIVIKEWGASTTLIGVLFAASVSASAIGTMAIGPLADRYGRKPCLIAMLILFGLATLLTALVSNVAELAAARILSSLALGASVPIAIALGSEAVGPHRRGAVAGAMSGSIAIGIVTSGLAAAALVPDHGWQSLMYVGGLFALALAAPVFLLVREPAAISTEARGRVGQLFGASYRRITLMILLAMTVIYAVSFFFNFWLPTLLLKSNPDMRTVALASALAQAMSLPGAFLTGHAMDRYGIKALAGVFAAGAVVLTLAVSLSADFALLVAGCCCVCLCINGALGGIIATPVQLYPHDMRATALGFTIGTSRLVGGSLGPLAGGWLLARDLPTDLVAAAFAPPLLLVALALLRLRGYQTARSPK